MFFPREGSIVVAILANICANTPPGIGRIFGGAAAWRKRIIAVERWTRAGRVNFSGRAIAEKAPAFGAVAIVRHRRVNAAGRALVCCCAATIAARARAVGACCGRGATRREDEHEERGERARRHAPRVLRACPRSSEFVIILTVDSHDENDTQGRERTGVITS